jgi:hypothetical protein
MANTWLTVAHVVLLAYLLIAVVVIVVVRRRRMKARWEEYLRSEPRPLQDWRRPSQPGFEAMIRGAMPHTPLPDWMYAEVDPSQPAEPDEPEKR